MDMKCTLKLDLRQDLNYYYYFPLTVGICLIKIS